jgi:serine/threonine protein kinase
MSARICIQGHRWQPAERADGEADGVCPVCGSPAEDSPTACDESAPVAREAVTLALPAQAPAAAAAPCPPPGYEILEELGRGGMGVVYKARQLGLNRVVALKMILAGSHAGGAELARFRGEAEAAARLRHPNIVQIYDTGEADGRPYFSLEFVDGGSLAQRLDGTPRPAREAANLVETLARAVQAAHQEGIIHRDLKPANVLLMHIEAPTAHGSGAREVAGTCSLGEESWVPKVADFGLAKRLGDAPGSGQTQTGTVLGTPSYMAPEQAAGRGQQVGPATDVYALGAILYELLTGRPPFAGPTPLETVMQVLSQDPVPPSHLQPKVPRDLEIICLKCLAKEPHRRYPSAAALADDIARFRADEPILARPAPAWERTYKWCRRRPTLAVLLGASALAAVALVATGLWYQRQLKQFNLHLQAALSDAEEQRDAATRARQDSEREHQRAQGHLTKALEAVDRMMTRVGDERLAQVPQFADLRQHVLEDALDFYRGFLRQEGSDPAVRRETARAYMRTGGLHLMLGRSAPAEESLKQSNQLLEQLTKDYPDRSEYRQDLSMANALLGHVYVITARFPAGASQYGKGLALSEQLVKEHPDQPDYREGLAYHHSNLGFFNLSINPAQSEPHFREAIRLIEELARTDPKQARYQAMLATSHGNLGMVLLARGRVPDARKTLERALELSGDSAALSIAGDDMGGLKFAGINPRLSRAMSQVALGSILSGANQTDRAEKLLQDGLATCEELHRASPKHFFYVMQLATSYEAAANFYERMARPADAERFWNQAVAANAQMERDYPTFPWLAFNGDRCRVRRMILVLRQKRTPDPVLKEAEAVAAKQRVSGDICYNLACAYALAAGLVGDDTARADRYALRALELLERGQKAGYPSTIGHVEHAREDEDLESLRSRKDFQDLLARWQEKYRGATLPVR